MEVKSANSHLQKHPGNKEKTKVLINLKHSQNKKLKRYVGFIQSIKASLHDSYCYFYFFSNHFIINFLFLSKLTINYFIFLELKSSKYQLCPPECQQKLASENFENRSEF